METMTLVALRRAIRHAIAGVGVGIVAPPWVISCSPKVENADGTLAHKPLVPSATTPLATRFPHCKISEPRPAGCSGREVMIENVDDCGLPKKGDIPDERCADLCGDFATRSCSVFARKDRPATVYCNAANPCVGRRSGRRRPSRRLAPSHDPVCASLREAARFEAASFVAFRELASELARFGAPVELRRACVRAADDEARHTAAMNGLLRERGARPLRARGRTSDRIVWSTLEALAIHNESEGVVGESWGALVAAYQARHAADWSVRRAMQTISVEEMRHAALSFRIARWARTRLGPAAAARLDRERSRAIDRLRGSDPVFPEDPADTLGWPRGQARALASGLASALAYAMR